MRGRNLQNARSELRIDRFIGDDWNFFACERTPGMFADKIGISFVAGMKSHRRVGHDRFRPGGCDFKKAARFFDDFVANEIQISLLRFANHFLIRERRLRCRIPINHPPTAIDQAFVIKIDENFLDSAA